MDVITIVIDVYPATGSKPATVVVAATPKDGTPHFASGPFADRHKLLDQAYGEAAKRAVKAEGRKQKAGSKKPAKAAKAESPEEPETSAAEADQIGPAEDKETATPLVEAPDELPVIEGDGEAQMELTLEGGNE